MKKKASKAQSDHPVIGWREWIALPDLGIEKIKAKVDTGAKTSALHAFFVEPYLESGEKWVRFGIHPLQNNEEFTKICKAKIADKRVVSDSGGHKEERYVIETTAVMGAHSWQIEMTLTNRDTMKFRMLLGRRALHDRFVVSSSSSYLTRSRG